MPTKEFFHKLCMELLEDIELNKICEEYHAHYHIKEVYDNEIMIIFFEIDKDNRRYTNKVNVDIGYLFAISVNSKFKEQLTLSIKNTVIMALKHPEEENSNDD